MNDNLPPVVDRSDVAEVVMASPVAAIVATGALWRDMVPPRYVAGKTAWLVSFIDLTGLMVAFFVLKFSMLTLDSQTWQVVSGSFQDVFAAKPAAVEAVVEGVNNAEAAPVAARSSVRYLDVLLHERLDKNPVWKTLRGREVVGQDGAEMVYDLPAMMHDPVAAKADWEALGTALRGWKNRVGVRVTSDGDLAAAARSAVAFVAILDDHGANKAFAEIAKGDASVQFVVRAR